MTLVIACLATAACTPTIKVAVAPITISAKLDANLRLRLDETGSQPTGTRRPGDSDGERGVGS